MVHGAQRVRHNSATEHYHYQLVKMYTGVQEKLISHKKTSLENELSLSKKKNSKEQSRWFSYFENKKK